MDKNDPLHRVSHPIPDFTREAIHYAATKGRGGKGCVITWAAGNGNESVDLDGYASHSDVLAIGACNEHSVRSVYSDYGNALFCCFPSGDSQLAGRPKLSTYGLYVADRLGMRGRSAGDYTDSFSGTSAATPGVAGVVALLLSVKPELTAREVKEKLRAACDQIDPANGNYQANGHSQWYGYGRINAQKLLEFDKNTPVVTTPLGPVLGIIEVCVAPLKGDREYFIIQNLGEVDYLGSITFECGKKTLTI
jgi:subtilisin family serine protease